MYDPEAGHDPIPLKLDGNTIGVAVPSGDGEFSLYIRNEVVSEHIKSTLNTNISISNKE